MNRRDLFQRMGGAAIGAVLASVGLRPTKAASQWTYAQPFNNSDNAPITLDNTSDSGPLRLWLNDRFYVDLPKDRYVDSVCVDYALAREWENLYDAECRVCPEFGKPWEVLPMKRIDGESTETET